MIDTNMSKQNSSLGDEIHRGILVGLPVTLAVIPFALVLGAAAKEKGLSFLEVFLMTAINFAGGSEMAAIQVWSNPPDILLIALITLLVNSRHILMGATLVPHMQYFSKKTCMLVLFFMCDESWALAHDDLQKKSKLTFNPQLSIPFYFGVALCIHFMWFSCCTMGAYIGPILGDVRLYGLDMAIPAVFIVIIRGMWNGLKAARPWILSLIVSAFVYCVIPGSWYIVAGSIAGLTYAYFNGGNKSA